MPTDNNTKDNTYEFFHKGKGYNRLKMYTTNNPNSSNWLKECFEYILKKKEHNAMNDSTEYKKGLSLPTMPTYYEFYQQTNVDGDPHLLQEEYTNPKRIETIRERHKTLKAIILLLLPQPDDGIDYDLISDKGKMEDLLADWNYIMVHNK